jgi:hypothetical protein
MNTKFSRLLLCLLFAGFTTASAMAQDNAANSNRQVREITGCLIQHGDQYLLLGYDGSTWQITDSPFVDLPVHRNKQVEVRGVVSDVENIYNNEMHYESAAEPHAESGLLQASEIHTIRDYCGQPPADE